MIRLTTNKGVIDIELNPEKAPVTCKNFEEYLKQQEGVKDPITNEAANGLANDKYTIAMARTNDPHSATCQFFINVADNDFLNFTRPDSRGYGYAVFGRVVAGFDVVDAIAQMRTGRVGWYDDVPDDDVVIEKVEILADS